MTPGEPDATTTLLARVSQVHRRFAGMSPRWAAFAPGRVNLIGDHTDYNAGFVLPVAIDRGCVAVASPRDGAGPGLGSESGSGTGLDSGSDSRARSLLVSADLAETVTIDLSPWVDPAELNRWLGERDASGPEPFTGAWPRYVYGALRTTHAFLDGSPPLPPLTLTFGSSVPIGAGLSSSAALEVAVALIAEQVLGRTLSGSQRAAACRQAEHQYAGVPCGIMDQLISVMGQAGHALLIDCSDESTRAIPMPAASEAVLVVVNSGIRHALAGGEYAARKLGCDRAAAKLGVPALREADLDLLARRSASLTEQEHRYARHVITENARTLAAAEALARGDLHAMGRLMNESHESLRDDFQVSVPEIDELVDAAQRTPGVFGARMTGGGFGGCVIALAEPDAVEHVEQAPRSLGLSAARFFVASAQGGARVLYVE